MIDLKTGASPLIISVPHAGTDIDESIIGSMTEAAKRLTDTDWFVDRLYGFVESQDITMIKSHVSRYVIDLNRAPDDVSLYPGQFTTGLCPVTDFSGRALYQEDREPDQAEIESRILTYWKPYHSQLADQIARVKAQHGYAILLDAHSIESIVPNLFQGVLTDLNFGTNQGKSCAKSLINALAIDTIREYSTVVDGRFKGGFITRNYGKPDNGVHAIQLEISQSCYMDEQNCRWDTVKARKLSDYLTQFCHRLSTWHPAQQA